MVFPFGLLLVLIAPATDLPKERSIRHNQGNQIRRMTTKWSCSLWSKSTIGEELA
jgi:hypothetical protein